MATPNYDVNYEDKRFQQVESDKKQALSEVEKTYGGMISESDKYYQAQIDATKQWADKQTQLQNEQTDFAIEQIEQQKAQAKQDYTKEQSGAYVDWQKQSNQYGAKSEEIAAGGMTNTGFAESSQVSMYNTYQNRVATAREAYGRAVLNYDNAIKDARIQNNAALAQIAFEALEKELTLSLEGFQYKNQLIIEQANKKTEVDNTYYSRYMDVLSQINTENALAENIRQYEKTFAEEQRQYNKTYDLQLKQYNEDVRQFNAQLAEEKRQYDTTMAYNKSKSSGSGGGGGSGGSSGGSGGSSKSITKSNNTTLKNIVNKNAQKAAEQKMAEQSAYNYLNALIASGASKDKVSNEIAIALRNGEISKAQAKKLRNTFTPRGLAY